MSALVPFFLCYVNLIWAYSCSILPRYDLTLLSYVLSTPHISAKMFYCARVCIIAEHAGPAALASEISFCWYILGLSFQFVFIIVAYLSHLVFVSTTAVLVLLFIIFMSYLSLCPWSFIPPVLLGSVLVSPIYSSLLLLPITNLRVFLGCPGCVFWAKHRIMTIPKCVSRHHLFLVENWALKPETCAVRCSGHNRRPTY